MRRRVLFAAGAALVLATSWLLYTLPPVVEVQPYERAGDIVARATEGSIVRLLPGEHAPFDLTRRVTVTAASGARVRGPVGVLADGVHLDGLTVSGGTSGISVRDAIGVTITGARISGASLHGIEIVSGAARIKRCAIDGLGALGQGIEVRNANGLPRTVVEGCTIDGGMGGIVSHVSRVEFRANRVTGTRLAAISINEMSEGIAERNTIEGVTGVALYCGDMSHCELRDNAVRGVAVDPGGARNRAGYGAIAWYHSTMRLSGNVFEVSAPEPVAVFIGSITTDRFPLGFWPPGWRGAAPALALVSTASLAGLVLVGLGVGPVVRRIRRRRAAGGLAVAFLAAAAGVQAFHMLEHGVQVFQVHVAQAEHRSGLVGRAVDTEWAHLGFNAMVFVAVAVSAALLLGRTHILAGSALAAASLIQAFHMIEHLAKIVQHLGTGVNPAPGLIGWRFNLVWFHYGINLAVAAGVAAAAIVVVRERRAAVRPTVHTTPELEPLSA